jgi:uncharacterized repeat protein (TIGR03803 family)
MDANGALYGVTSYGGAANAGTVYKLSPSNNVWTKTVLHDFARDGVDGMLPISGVRLEAGLLYGVTGQGGSTGCGGTGCGTAYSYNLNP